MVTPNLSSRPKRRRTPKTPKSPRTPKIGKRSDKALWSSVGGKMRPVGSWGNSRSSAISNDARKRKTTRIKNQTKILKQKAMNRKQTNKRLK